MEKLSKVFFVLLAACVCAACGGGDDSPSAPSSSTDSGNNNNGSGTSSSKKLPQLAPNRTLAFPGADGGAANITGGAEGDVYVVTNLNDNGPGSLRYGSTTNNRTIVFAVAGQINLQSRLTLHATNLTIAGQSAPGDGITIAGYPVYITGSNIILRYLRFRMGDQNKDNYNFKPEDGDALGGKECSRILVDHCSISYSSDECASFSRNTNFTMQYCIVSESMKNAGHEKNAHGYGGIWGGRNASYHHNLLAHHDSRNPRFDHEYVGDAWHGPIDYVNNVVYNWGSNSTYGGEAKTTARQFHINMVGNYYKAGPSSSNRDRLLELTSYCSNCGGEAVAGLFFLDGNYVNGLPATWENNVDSEHSKGETRDKAELKKAALLGSRWSEGLTAMAFTESATDAYNSVLTYAGASLKRDAVDRRIVDDVKNGTGAIVDKVSDNLGYYYPALDGGTPATDEDLDGMPDAWEMEQMQALGVTDKTITDFKPAAYNLTSKYTNLEVYLNSLVTSTFPPAANASAIK